MLRAGFSVLIVVACIWIATFLLQAAWVRSSITVQLYCADEESLLGVTARPDVASAWDISLSPGVNLDRELTFTWSGVALFAPSTPIIRELYPFCQLRALESRTVPAVGVGSAYCVPIILMVVVLLPRNRQDLRHRILDRSPKWRKAMLPAAMLGIVATTAYFVTIEFPTFAPTEPPVDFLDPYLLPLPLLLAPVLEELWFRGVLQSRIAESGYPFASILASGYLFAAFHFLIAPQETGVARIATLLLTGVALALAAHRTQSLLPAVLLHLINNLSALALMGIQTNSLQ